MIEKAGRIPAHWPVCQIQATDLHDDDVSTIRSQRKSRSKQPRWKMRLCNIDRNIAVRRDED